MASIREGEGAKGREGRHMTGGVCHMFDIWPIEAQFLECKNCFLHKELCHNTRWGKGTRSSSASPLYFHPPMCNVRHILHEICMMA
jgi:hypothetical protein